MNPRKIVKTFIPRKLFLKIEPYGHWAEAIVENIIYNNAFSKAKPLFINIYTSGENKIVIENTIQPKKAISIMNFEETLNSLITKYSMHTAIPVTIEETKMKRRITIPLIENTEVTV